MDNWSQNILRALENKDVGDNASLYNNKFFQDHLKYRPIYNFLGDVIAGYLKPKSCIDWGCGCGFLLDRLAGHGVSPIKGLEGSDAVVKIWDSELSSDVRSQVSVVDITSDIDNVGVYDLAVCMEVAEHIEEDRILALVEKICASSSRYIWWTAAQPGQGGTGHINCQSLCYWEQLFLFVGWKVDWVLTYEMKQVMLQNHAICLAYPWFRDNLMVLEKVR